MKFRAGDVKIIDSDRAIIQSGQHTRLSGGGYMVLYRGDLNEKQETSMFKRCVKDAINKILITGSEQAAKVANKYKSFLAAGAYSN